MALELVIMRESKINFCCRGIGRMRFAVFRVVEAIKSRFRRIFSVVQMVRSDNFNVWDVES